MSQEAVLKTMRSLGIATAGFVLAWLSTNVIPQIDQTNTTGMLAVALFSVIVDLFRRNFGGSDVVNNNTAGGADADTAPADAGRDSGTEGTG